MLNNKMVEFSRRVNNGICYYIVSYDEDEKTHILFQVPVISVKKNITAFLALLNVVLYDMGLSAFTHENLIDDLTAFDKSIN
jgi:hypothetical protein